MPSEEELHLVDRLLEEFLKTEMDRLQRFMEGETMDRWGDHGQEGEGDDMGGGHTGMGGGDLGGGGTQVWDGGCDWRGVIRGG